MVHAGILTPHGGDVSKAELTSGFPEAAKERFIKEVIDELTGNSQANPLAFPCGVQLQPIPKVQSDLLLDLADEKKYPAFHKDILGHYKEIAQKLDKTSNFSLLPICDPIALGTKLGINVSIPSLAEFVPFLMPCPPLLAAKLAEGDMSMTPLKLAEKLPGLIAEAQIPPKIDLKIDLPVLPELTVPGVPNIPDFSVPNLLNFKLALVLGFPNFIVELIGNILSFVLKIATGDINGALGEVCKIIAEEAQLFGSSRTDDVGNIQDTIQNASRKVLARKTAEMSLFVVMSQTLGTSPSGLVGNFARTIDYSPPLGEGEFTPDEEYRIREIMWRAMQQSAGYRWSAEGGGEYKGLGYRPWGRQYSEFLFPQEFSTGNPDKITKALEKGRTQSSCATSARALLARAGAIFYFNRQIQYSSSTRPDEFTAPGTYTITKARAKYKQETQTYIDDLGQEATRKKIVKDGYETILEAVLVYDFFNDEYTGGVLEALSAVASYRDATLTPRGEGVSPYQLGVDDLPAMKRGDIIFIQRDGKKRLGSDHVMVVEQDYYPGSGVLYTWEGGLIDFQNDDPRGHAYIKDSSIKKGTCTAIKKKTYYTKEKWPNPQRPDGVPYPFNPTDGYAQVLTGVGCISYDYNSDTKRKNVTVGGRFVVIVVDSYALIKGNPPKPGAGIKPADTGRSPVTSTAVLNTTDGAGQRLTSIVGGTAADVMNRESPDQPDLETVQATGQQIPPQEPAPPPPTNTPPEPPPITPPKT
jgi:hypothetical protein